MKAFAKKYLWDGNQLSRTSVAIIQVILFAALFLFRHGA